MTTFRRLALATTLTTLAVIGVGGLVRATGSGDGCPDWPRCFGRWIPPLEKHALIEYSHRTIGAVAIFLLLATAFVTIRRLRHERSLTVPIAIATPSILMQAVLGAIVVHIKTTPSLDWLEPWFVTFHIATAMGLIAVLVIATVRAYALEHGGPLPDNGRDGAGRAALIAVFTLLLAGAYLRGEGAALAFPDWPLMNGGVLPRLDGPFGVHFTHRAFAGAAGIVLGWYVLRAWRARVVSPASARFAVLAGALFLAQAVVGGLQIITKLDAAAVTAHVFLSGAVWASTMAAVSCARRLPRAGIPATLPPTREPAPIAGGQVGLAVQPASWTSTVGAYIRLTKPRIISLLLITTVPTMALATGGWPSFGLVMLTLIGGTLAAGSANTINMVLDRDIDAVMGRTRLRPLPANQVPPARALIFGLVLAAVSFALMTTTVNLLSALLAQSAIAFYVFVYTMGLKRSTPQNIVIGGAAGAVPVLVGWAAVTGTVGAPAWVLFGIIFLWTPPHFWALALRFEKDYAAAGVPMMPVVAGGESTRRQIVGYTVLTIIASVALAPVASMGLVYVVAAVALGGWFLGYTLVLLREASLGAALRTFGVSIAYLALLFGAVAADAVLR